MKISTCRYMRYKMKIDTESDNCSQCGLYLETLPHIFLYCSSTKRFVERVNNLIITKIDGNFRDNSNIHFFTCCHNNPIINYINLTAKWYISRQFQTKKEITWQGYLNTVKLLLQWEKTNIVSGLRHIL